MNTNINPLGYKLFSQPEKLFGINYKQPKHEKFLVEKIKENLKSFDYETPNQKKIFEGDLNLPDLIGEDIRSHFENMAEDLLGEKFNLIKQFAEQELLWNVEKIERAIDHPSFDTIAGWQRFHISGDCWEKVEYPEEGVLIYDTETYVLGGNYPIIGQALSHSYLYIWLPNKLDPQKNLIPVGHNKILIGANIGFDLGKTNEPYTLDEHDNLWVDTQSMHIIVAGLASGQRWYKALKNSSHKGTLTEEQRKKLLFNPKWGNKGSTNSLVEVYNHHVVELGGFLSNKKRLSESDKKVRDVFVKGSLETIQNGIRNGSLLKYAVLDVLYTFEVFQALYPKFIYHKPSKVSFAGLMLRMDGRIPLCKDWFQWIENCETKYNELQERASMLFKQEARKVYERFTQEPNFWEEDPWLNQLKWDVKSTKGKYKNIPTWYRPFIKDENFTISTKTDLAHLLLKLTWEGSPIIKIKDRGWSYFKHDRLERIPHYKEEGANVGELITKNYMYAVKAGILESQGNQECQEIFEIAKACSYWRGIRQRVIEKIVKVENGNLLTVAEPIPFGTITGRQVERLLLTLCSTKKDKIGTSLKTRITAPDGWSVVGFDIDQQELHIAALLADFQCGGVVGGSPLSFQVLTGNKSDGTDAHSALANFLGISRDAAKPLNFLAA